MSTKKRKPSFYEQNKRVIQDCKSVISNWDSLPMREHKTLVGFAKNGITLDDLAKDVEKARNKAFADTSPAVLKTAYACMATVLVDNFGFSKDQCFEALHEVDKKIALSIDDEILIAEMAEKAGIVYDTKDGFERIKQL